MSDAISDGAQLSRPLQRDLQWAHEHGKHGMARVSELEAQGWVKVAEHEVYSGSWLMERK